MTKFIDASCDVTDDLQSSLLDAKFVDCWISFGGNIGDVKATFDAALALLSLHSHIRLGRRSGIYSTIPMGTQAGSPFLNSVCELSTQLVPGELLRVLQSVENQLGRVREMRWGPRTLDLDLLNYGDQIVNDPNLVIPHPAVTYRRFVLDPLVEIDPDWRNPQFSVTAGQMLARLKLRPLKVVLLDVSAEQIEKLSVQLKPPFPNLQLVNDAEDSNDVLPIRMTPPATFCEKAVVDLRHSPGCMLEQLTSAFTAIFDAPERVSNW